MARGIRRALACDLAVAITGVAGPDGGTADKPVGTVHVAVADGEEIFPKRLTLRGDRSLVRHVSVRWAHKLLWDRLVARGAATISACDD
jgi:PncC family amidohydrolase